MIFASVLSGFGLKDFLWMSGLCALAALMLLWPRSQRAQQIQCVIFIAIGVMCLAFAWARGHGEIPIRQMVTQNHLLISLLCAVSFLRLITDTRAASGKVPKKGGSVFTDHYRTSFFLLRHQSVGADHFCRFPVQGSETGPYSSHKPAARIFAGSALVALLRGDGNLSLICARHASARSMVAVYPALRFRANVYLG